MEKQYDILVKVENLVKWFPVKRWFFQKPLFVKAVDDCATRITFIVDAIKNMTYKLTKFVSAFVMLFTINPVLFCNELFNKLECPLILHRIVRCMLLDKKGTEFK